MFEETADRAIAIVGMGAILPDAPSVRAFWDNLRTARYSVSEVSAGRWDPARYYDPDPHALDKSYSKIGGWVREAAWDPIAWKLPIPPKVSDAMDEGQRWAIACTREALADYGYPERPLDRARTAVILGNAMAGEKHYMTALRIFFPEYASALSTAPSFAALPREVQEAVLSESRALLGSALPPITEDTMPGELGNCIAGRIANLFDLHGPNYIVDAACASAVAAMSAAIEGLTERDFDVAITGGIDRNMGASAYVKFCKIGALSATGTRPYADGADGFVMGEGAAVFVLKRLADAERDGDKVYAVIRGIGGSSDGKGKGITAPNPVGQKLAIERAWDNARLSPATCSLVEGHGTSTRVGDVVEVESLSEVFAAHGAKPGALPLGSVKSNIGHLKAAAGAAGILKVALALHHKEIPPSLGFARPNPAIPFGTIPFYVPTEHKPWEEPACGVRRAAVSAFGFGGTNFHAVLEEHTPYRLTRPKTSVPAALVGASPVGAAAQAKAPLRGALVLGAKTPEKLAERLLEVQKDAQGGKVPPSGPPSEEDITSEVRIAIDYGNAAELAEKAAKALKAARSGDAAAFRMLRQQGIFLGTGKPGKVAFLYTGQGSQYVNMLADLRRTEPLVGAVFSEADRVMTPLLGRPLSRFIFVDGADAAAKAKAEEDLKQTAITQPAILATDIALTRLLAAYGVFPDQVMGHSLGEYGALVAAGGLPFSDALEAVSARGREMTRLSVEDNGWMVAVTAPLEEIQKVVSETPGYVVIANKNSRSQAVIGGASTAVEHAMNALVAKGYTCIRLPVSHAFHTRIVAPASGPLREVLMRQHVTPPTLPIVANVTGELYPMDADARPKMIDLLSEQVAAPVEFVKGLETLYREGARVFVEVGPKKALAGFVEDVLVPRGDVVALATNHPKLGDIVSFNHALCGLYAAGIGRARPAAGTARGAPAEVSAAQIVSLPSAPASSPPSAEPARAPAGAAPRGGGQDVVITGAALGLPGTPRVFDDQNISRILHGDDFLDVVPTRFRRAMLEKHITRVVKGEDGSGSFQVISDPDEVIRLAARAGQFDLGAEFGISAERIAALDIVTQLAIGAGIDALRDSGIPLVRRYKTTSKGTRLPDRWALPDELCDDTGIVFASAFPGYDALVDDLTRYHRSVARREQLELIASVERRLGAAADPQLMAELRYRRETLAAEEAREPYTFDRRFLFRILAMGHSQFAELIGARGPNTHVNAACASTTQAVSIAEDWIRAGRCRRVLIVAADDVTSDRLMEWMGAGFLSTGAAATDDVIERAALPFDKRRHGMLLGMGAAAIVVESAALAAERGLTPICRVRSSITANSAFHGTRLDVEHIGKVMEALVRSAEAKGISRREMAAQMVFVSHETYTPARGGSASAEIHALRQVFGEDAARIVIANTKGFTGHPMGVGIEDVVAIKALETGIVPPVPHFHEVDPELGPLHLSQGGPYPVKFALRLGAGFGSQISMTLMEWTPPADGQRRAPSALGYVSRIADSAAHAAWLSRVSGQATPELEVMSRTLRIKDRGAPTSSVSAAAAPERGALDLNTRAPAPLPVAPQAPPPQAPPPAAPRLPEKAPSAASAAPVAPPAAPPPAPVAPPASAVAPALSGVADVREKVLGVVAEKTGYPRDMLDLELDLEADLGVDTVKQAETFAAVRALYNIPRDEKLKLRDFPTLGHVVKFVLDRRPDLAGAASVTVSAQSVSSAPVAAPAQTATSAPLPASPAATSAPAAGSFEDEVRESVLSVVAEKTGYPRDMLDLELDLEADLGVDTVKQAETFAAVRALYNIPRDEKLKLRDFPTLGHVMKFVLDRRPDLAGAASVTVSAQAVSSAPVAAPAQTATSAPLAASPASPAAVSAPLPASPAAASAPLAASPAVPAPAAGSFEDEVRGSVLSVVAEKTGYPRDMLDLELDLEADLGVDTVKQAETFAAVRALYNIPRDEKLKLRDFPTLGHVVKFVLDRRPDLAGAAPSAAMQQAVSDSPAPAQPTIAKAPSVLSFDAMRKVPRRVPVPRLRPPLAMCKPTGVTLGSGTRVVVMTDAGGVATALTSLLSARGVEVLTILGAPAHEELVSEVTSFAAAGPVSGVYWLPALDVEPEELDAHAWGEGLRVRVKLLADAMRALYEAISTRATFLVAGTRLGGAHGYDAAGATAPMGGAVTGFVKAYKREREAALVKAVDFAQGVSGETIAELLIAETLQDPGAVEVGYHEGSRVTVGLEEAAAENGGKGLTLDKNSVIVVTGAAGSIVSAITSDIAARTGATFHLLDLAPAPDPEDPDLRRFATDREGLKRDLFERMKARGERATPALVEKELAQIERRSAALSAVLAISAAGGTAHYHSVHLGDPEGVYAALAGVRSVGRADVLIHAAGIEISRFLPDKSPAEYERVLDVKASGWRNVMAGLSGVPLGAAVVFSSIAGRFGNGGQTDYSAANDLLCKQISALRNRRPETRGIAIDWTAWAGIGMASRGSIPKMMELAGIDMLPAEAGIPVTYHELVAGSYSGEVVIADRLGILLREHDDTGGIEPASAVTAEYPMIGRVVSSGVTSPLVVETELDPKVEPFLHHHRIDGTAVLPGVMGMEGFAEAASLLVPGARVKRLLDVRFLAPFKLYRDEPRALRLEVLLSPAKAGAHAQCRLVGARVLPGRAEPVTTVHFEGLVELCASSADADLPAQKVSISAPERAPDRTAADIYQDYFHGPAYQVLEAAWIDGQTAFGRMSATLGPNSSRGETLIEPRCIELCFQTAGIWEMARSGRMGLPNVVSRLVLMSKPGEGPMIARVTARPDGAFDAEVADASGAVWMALSGYRTIALSDSAPNV